MKLRFKDENGNNYPDWEKKKIGNHFIVSAGGDINRDNFTKLKTSINTIPVLSNSLINKGLHGYTNIPKGYKDTVTITGRGKLGVAIARENDYFPIVRLLVLSKKDIKFNNFFIAEQINQIKIFIESTGVPQLTAPMLSQYIIDIPKSLEEQEKIGSFFKLQDEVIELKEELIKEKREYKKGLLQKVFNQELRFKDEKGNNYPDWKKQTISNLTSYEQPTKYIVNSTEYSDLYDTPVLTAGKSLILGKTDEKQGIKVASIHEPTIIFDDFTTNMHYITYPFKVKSSAMKLINVDSKNNNPKFIYEAIKNIDYIPQAHERHWISIFMDFKLYIPQSLEEQEKIGNLFKAIDEEIELLENEVIQLKQKKKYYLSVMM